MGKPLILKGFWNVRRLIKYRQKKLKISGNVVKKILCESYGKIYIKETALDDRNCAWNGIYHIYYPVFYPRRPCCCDRRRKLTVSFTQDTVSYSENDVADILARNSRIYEAKKILAASSTCSGASI